MKLIDKSVLVAEIERRLDDLYDYLPDASKAENGTITISEACNTGKYTALESLMNYIDTLEVKEVDLEKKINNYFNGWGIDIINGGQYGINLDIRECKDIARDFFELGLKAQKGEVV